MKILDKIINNPGIVIDWNRIHFYWGDERCVPPDNPESNYNNLWNGFLKFLEIPSSNIHRIMGENKPEIEVSRYSALLFNLLPVKDDLPRFDLVFLGLGEDGHTASIFPGISETHGNEVCFFTHQPLTNQGRISLSLKLLNNSKKIIFLVTGNSKARVLKEIIGRGEGYLKYPAGMINPYNGSLDWFLDEDAAAFL
jgi:6-phosphogluconolactonase